MLVLRIFPLGPYTLLEEMVVSLEAEFGSGSNVVLDIKVERLVLCSS